MTPEQQFKVIALEAALKVFTPHNETAEDIVEAATTIYNWLIKDEAQVPMQNLKTNP